MFEVIYDIYSHNKYFAIHSTHLTFLGLMQKTQDVKTWQLCEAGRYQRLACMKKGRAKSRKNPATPGLLIRNKEKKQHKVKRIAKQCR